MRTAWLRVNETRRVFAATNQSTLTTGYVNLSLQIAAGRSAGRSMALKVRRNRAEPMEAAP